jgi:hypothetical protein
MKPHILSTLLVLGILGSFQVIRADSFLYSNSTFSPINVPGVRSQGVNVTGINNSGEIVGYTALGVSGSISR